MSLRDRGFGRRNLREGGGRGTGDDHVDSLYGITELSIYQTPNTKPKGYEGLKAFLEAQDCEIVYTNDAPPELSRHETLRITHSKAEPIPIAVVTRAHRWAHNRNYLHSFFRPMYR
jgi:hypothetical protein